LTITTGKFIAPGWSTGIRWYPFWGVQGTLTVNASDSVMVEKSADGEEFSAASD